MTDTITITGLVATDPRHLMTAEALPITSFRLASTQRRFDRASSKWVDGETNWYTVTAFRQLALNSNLSVKKGDRVVVSGKVRVRSWESGEKNGTTVEVEAEALGHDLLFGTAAFTRSMSAAARQTDAPATDAAISPWATDTATPATDGASESFATDEFPSEASTDFGPSFGSDAVKLPAVDEVAVPF
jgi:single-strand DNA-binding protein